MHTMFNFVRFLTVARKIRYLKNVFFNPTLMALPAASICPMNSHINADLRQYSSLSLYRSYKARTVAIVLFVAKMFYKNSTCMKQVSKHFPEPPTIEILAKIVWLFRICSIGNIKSKAGHNLLMLGIHFHPFLVRSFKSVKFVTPNFSRAMTINYYRSCSIIPHKSRRESLHVWLKVLKFESE